MAKLHVIDYGANADLPQSVRDAIPDDGVQTVFRQLLNHALNDGKSEMHAFLLAWKGLSAAGFHEAEGKWVAKTQPAVGDVHVDRPLGGKKPKQKDDPGGDPADVEEFEEEADKIAKAGNGVMLAFWPDPDLAAALAVPGGEDADQLHLTLAYFGKLADVGTEALPKIEQACERFASSHGPIKATLSGVGRFPATPSSDGQDVAYLGVHSPEMIAFRDELVEDVESSGVEPKKNFNWTPHITLKMLAPNAPHMIAAPHSVDVTFSFIRLSIGGASKDFHLTGERIDKKHTPWIGVDLDGTLAEHTDSHDVIGAPVPKMIDRVKAWIAEGKTVKILTARVADDPDGKHKKQIKQWLKENLGQKLKVTATKDPDMTALYDDRAHGVNRNQGTLKAYVPPDEVRRAAKSAWDAGNAVLDVTAPLAEGTGLGIAEVRKIAAHFADASTLTESDSARDAWGGREAGKWAGRVLRKADGPAATEYDWHAEGNIVKLDAPQQLVFGWASIVKVGDRTLTDTQDDQISPDTIEAAAYDFVMHARIGGAMHNQDGNEQPIQVSTLVESVVFTDEKVAAIVKSLTAQGIEASMDLGCVGWWVGFKVADKATWDAIADGTLKAFSVGGRGKREKIGKAEPQTDSAVAKALKRVERALAWHESA